MTIQKSGKQIMKENHVKQYEVAYALGIHEGSLSRKLRNGETEELHNEIVEAIKQIKSGRYSLQKGMYSTMANRRMIDTKIVNSLRFLEMGKAAQALYLHIIADADDEGVAEAGTVLRITKTRKTALQELIDNGFVVMLDPKRNIVYTKNWHNFNHIDARCGRPSFYHDTLEEHFPDIEFVDFTRKNGTLNVDDTCIVQYKSVKESEKQSSIVQDNVGTGNKITRDDFFSEPIPSALALVEIDLSQSVLKGYEKEIRTIAGMIYRTERWNVETSINIARSFFYHNKEHYNDSSWNYSRWQGQLTGFLKREKTPEDFNDLPFE